MARPPARDLGDEFIGGIGMRGVVHANRGAVLRQKPRGRTPDAAGPAGHQRHLIAPCHYRRPRRMG